MSKSHYKMTVSLNVLNHLGLNLYSNTPAVLAEVIANAWDADATKVNVDFDTTEMKITVEDNGNGMNSADINDKYLRVGYQKRVKEGLITKGGRKPMGRKGIGKLSLFSIANNITVYSKKLNELGQAFELDAEDIKRQIDNEDPSISMSYEPKAIPFEEKISEKGTIIIISNLKKVRLTEASIRGLRKKIARRFGLIGDLEDFAILINGEKVTLADRDYFHKVRFLFQYGEHDYSKQCANIDDRNDSIIERSNKLNYNGDSNENDGFSINGWIGVARHSNDLDDSENKDDNLNKITIVVRNKVALEDILQEIRLGGMITKYIFGEIHADFLDLDTPDYDDIATSGRQGIQEDDPRYIALKSFLDSELRYIWRKTNKLKESKGLEEAVSSNPHIKEWYDTLKPKSLKETAKKIFAQIDQAGVDETQKSELYANGILAFQALKMNYALEQLDNIDFSNLDAFIAYLKDIDAIEAGRYHEIVKGRLKIIDKLDENLEIDVMEKVIEKYIFDHLWLLDPAWERATAYADIETRMKKVIERIQTQKTVISDIRYRRISGGHVIIELKRHSVSVTKTDIEAQIRKYIDAVEVEKSLIDEENKYPISAVCIVGKLPQGWSNEDFRKKDEESLRIYSIRVMTYRELIYNARSAYRKFSDASREMDDFLDLIDKIRNY